MRFRRRSGKDSQKEARMDEQDGRVVPMGPGTLFDYLAAARRLAAEERASEPAPVAEAPREVEVRPERGASYLELLEPRQPPPADPRIEEAQDPELHELHESLELPELHEPGPSAHRAALDLQAEPAAPESRSEY
jgi:hypothetical protein